MAERPQFGIDAQEIVWQRICKRKSKAVVQQGEGGRECLDETAFAGSCSFNVPCGGNQPR